MSALRPYVVLSGAMSVDGRIGGTGPERLLLSNEADFDAVDALRAAADAILVGAGTVRADNPRLVVRSEARRQRRRSAGKPPDPIKVTLTASGRLDPTAAFFIVGEAEKLVYTTVSGTQERLGAVATVVELRDADLLGGLLADLARRGIARLLIEGGSAVNTAFLAGGYVDELRLAVAPFFVGSVAAPHFVAATPLPHSPERPMRLLAVQRFGDVAVLHYRLGLP